MNAPRSIFLLTTFLLLSAGGCSPEQASGNDTEQSEDAFKANGQPDEVHFDVKWKPSTITVEESAALNAWRSAESAPDEGVYVFDDNGAMPAEIAQGKIVLLPKIGLFKITKATRANGKLTLTTEPGSLLEAADEGDVSWEIDTTNHEVVALQRKAGSNSNSAATATATGPRTLRPLDEALPPPRDSIDFKTSADGYEIALKMKNHIVANGRAAISFDIMGGVEEEARGAVASAKATLKGYIAFRSGGVIKFKDGELLDFTFRMRDVDLDATATFEVDSMTVRGDLVDYESRIIVPFMAGPVPLYYALGGAVNMNASMGTGQSMKLSGRMVYKGDLGFEVEGASVKNKIVTAKPVLTGQATPDVRGEATIVSEIAMPRIELGMGVPHLEKAGLDASAGLYVDLRAGMGAKAMMELSSGPCLEAIAAMQAYYGGQAKFFGLKLSKEAPLMKFAEHTARRGTCPEE